jgi:hypothetical protein
MAAGKGNHDALPAACSNMHTREKKMKKIFLLSGGPKNVWHIAL